MTNSANLHCFLENWLNPTDILNGPITVLMSWGTDVACSQDVFGGAHSAWRGGYASYQAWLYKLLCVSCPHLKACGPWFPRGDVSVIVDLELRHNCDGRLNDEGDDVRPHLLDVDAFGRKPVQHAGQGALAARVLAVGVHEVAAVHVEGVVGEVHEDVSQVLLAWFLDNESHFSSGTRRDRQEEWRRGYLIGLGAESRQAFLGDVDLQRLQGLDQHVEADVELELVDEQRPVDVLLHHHLLGLRTRHQLQLAGVPNEVDAVALRAPVRLYDEGGIQSGILLLYQATLQ